MKYYLDWDKECLWLLDDEGGFQALEGWALFDLLEVLERTDEVYLESTFESYNTKERNRIVAYAQRHGPHLLTVPTRATGRILGEMEAPRKNENANERNIYASFAIQEFVARGRAVKKPVIYSGRVVSLRGEYEAKRRGEGFRVRDLWVEEQMRPLHSFRVRLPEEQHVLGDKLGHNYDLPFVLSMVVACKESSTSTREEFERRVGMYDHGYPSFYRSQFMRRVKTLTCRELNVRSLKNLTRDQYRPTMKHIEQLLRKVVRRMYFIYKSQSGKHLPETGTLVPPATSSLQVSERHDSSRNGHTCSAGDSKSQSGNHLPETGTSVPPATSSLQVSERQQSSRDGHNSPAGDHLNGGV